MVNMLLNFTKTSNRNSIFSPMRGIYILLSLCFISFFILTSFVIYKIHYNFYSKQTLTFNNNHSSSSISTENANDSYRGKNNYNYNDNYNNDNKIIDLDINHDLQSHYISAIDLKLSNLVKSFENKKYNKVRKDNLLAENKFLKHIKDYKNKREDVVGLIDELVAYTDTDTDLNYGISDKKVDKDKIDKDKIDIDNNGAIAGFDFSGKSFEINGDELISNSSVFSSSPYLAVAQMSMPSQLVDFNGDGPLVVDVKENTSVKNASINAPIKDVVKNQKIDSIIVSDDLLDLGKLKDANLSASAAVVGSSKHATNTNMSIQKIINAVDISSSASAVESAFESPMSSNSKSSDGLAYYDYPATSNDYPAEYSNEYSKGYSKDYSIEGEYSKNKSTHIVAATANNNSHKNSNKGKLSSKVANVANVNNGFVNSSSSPVSERVDNTIKNTINELSNRNPDLEKVAYAPTNYDLIEVSSSANTKDKEVLPVIPSAIVDGKIPEHIKNKKDKISSEPFLVASSKSVNSNRGYLSTITLRTYNVLLDKGMRSDDMTTFDFRPFYSSNSAVNDDGAGEIVIKSRINSSMNILSGSVLKNNQIPSNISLVMSPGAYIYSVPSFDIDSFSRFLDSKKLTGKGGFILVDMDEKTEDIDIDADYEAKLFFDDDFRVVANASGAQFVMLTGVLPGNRILNFKTYDKRVVKKVVYVSEDEILFDSNSYVFRGAFKYDLYSNNLFQKSKSNLNISAKRIKYFNESGRQAKKMGINHYEIANVLLPIGTRVYTEFDHLRENIFVGRWDNNEVHLPTNEYINQIFNTLGIYSLNGSCMIQLNLNKRPRGFMAEGKAPEGLNLDMRFLNFDGTFTEMISDMTSKIFLLGDAQGVVNFRMDYLDGSKDIFETYCSRDTYLVEQL
ncbi:MAG: hypothetical protein HQK49_21410 [Oligoflexia bacterium]|nr:hypothetical protein [Oligoflexia bacterium]